MGIIFAVVIAFVVAGVVVWMTPLRSLLLQSVKSLDSYKFTCKIDNLVDESKPVNQDQSFAVQMIGRIPTPEDNHDTDVKIEINDVTKSLFDPEKILSADENFRSCDDVGFHFTTHNGVVPKKNAVLSRWVTVTQVPCHVLRFAYRGRRKLQFKVSVLSKQTGQLLTSSQQTIEYVYCEDGFREIQDRRMDMLNSTIELAVIASAGDNGVLSDVLVASLNQWIDQKAQHFAPAAELKQVTEALKETASPPSIETSSKGLLAHGDQTDKVCTVELSLQLLSVNQTVTANQLERLFDISKQLDIKHDRLLVMAQKILLSSDCKIENPAMLLGISNQMDEDCFRKTLNEEYRKWNARVTHPDADIRQQADQILTLIAELRSQRPCHC